MPFFKEKDMDMDAIYTFICKAHEGQVDKGGNDYILHPLAVASMVDTEEEKIVALLHDVVEDTTYTLKDLQKLGCSNTVIQAIEAITRKDGEPYYTYLDRVKQNPLAKVVKNADLKHNSDLSRITNPTKKDKDRVKRYSSYMKYLNED